MEQEFLLKELCISYQEIIRTQVIYLGSNSTITSDAGNQTVSGTINGAHTLGITPAANWTQSGNIGATTAPTQLTIGTTSSTGDVTLSGTTTVSGAVTVYGDDITLSENINTSAGGANGDV